MYTRSIAEKRIISIAVNSVSTYRRCEQQRSYESSYEITIITRKYIYRSDYELINESYRKMSLIMYI
jgi:hypothetical protein